MSTIEDFKNVPIGTTATDADGNRTMKVNDGEQCWITPWGFYLNDVDMGDFTLDVPAPTSVREALDIAWELAYEVKPGQVIPAGTRYLEDQGSGLNERHARCDFNISPGIAPSIRTLKPLPDPEPDWLDAPAVIAATCRCPDQKVRVPKADGHWKCSCCRDEHHWSDLVDVTPLYPKESEE